MIFYLQYCLTKHEAHWATYLTRELGAMEQLRVEIKLRSPVKAQFQGKKTSQILTKYSSIEKPSVLQIGHPLDHFYEPLAIDYFDGLPYNWSSNKKTTTDRRGKTFHHCLSFLTIF